jgi:DNA-binding PadR family transcriptional regulator
MKRGSGPEKFMKHGHRLGAPYFEKGGIKFAILDLLRDTPRHGYDIIREMEQRSGGLYSPSPGAVYPTLQALEDQDLLTSATQEGKKVYAITQAGLAYLEEHKDRVTHHRERWAAHWGQGPHGEGRADLSETRDVLAEIMAAVRKSAGDPGKMEQIRGVLEHAARKAGEIADR